MAPKPPKESPPVLHSAIPGQGLYSIGDAGGNRRWIGSGREVNGWKVGDYDKKSNTLMVTKGDRKEYLQMGSGSISDYTPPVATPNAETIGGGGGGGNGGQLSEVELNLTKLEDDNGVNIGLTQQMNNSILNENGELNREQFLKMKNIGDKFRKAMNTEVPTATPTPDPAAPQGGPKTYLAQDAYGQIQRQYYIGDLPDDAIPGQEEK